MAVLTYQDVLELHKEKFGQYPVITGIRYNGSGDTIDRIIDCLLYTSPSPRDLSTSRMPSSA